MTGSGPPRREALLALAALALAGGAAPAGAQGSAGEDVTRAVLALRERIRAAAAKGDRAALGAAYAEGFNHIRPAGRVDLKAQRIALVLSGEPTIETAPEDGVTVQGFGDAVAVAQGVSLIKDARSGRTARYRWLSVYARLEGSWRLCLSQATALPPGRARA